MKAYNSPSKRECYGTPSLTARRLLHYRRSLIPAFFPSQGEKLFLHKGIQNGVASFDIYQVNPKGHPVSQKQYGGQGRRQKKEEAETPSSSKLTEASYN